MDTNMKKLNMAPKCKLTNAMTNEHAYTYYMCAHMCKIWTCYNQNCGLQYSLQKNEQKS